MPAPLSIPCPQAIRGCDCTLDPVTNYSSEDPDQPVFISTYNNPPVTGTYFAPGCLAICESTVSQNAADDCAAAQAAECSFDAAPQGGNPLPGGEYPARRFSNASQNCDADCGDGNVTTVTVPPGTVVSATQADADARAHGLACKRAEELKVCFVTASPLPESNADVFESVPIVAVGGNGDYLFTLESGTLPIGISLDGVGLLSGTPTVPGTYNFSIRVDDSGGATAVKAFTWMIASACDMATDWCNNPGTCRLRIKNFNFLDWTYVWLGNLDQVGPAFPPSLPCKSYSDGADAGLGFVASALPQPVWQFTILCPDLTSYLATGPAGPLGTSPIGVYTWDGTVTPCGGPLSFEIEAYTP